MYLINRAVRRVINLPRFAYGVPALLNFANPVRLVKVFGILVPQRAIFAGKHVGNAVVGIIAIAVVKLVGLPFLVAHLVYIAVYIIVVMGGVAG